MDCGLDNSNMSLLTIILILLRLCKIMSLFSRNIFKFLELKEHDISNLPWNSSGKIKLSLIISSSLYTQQEWEKMIKKMGHNVR